MDSLIGLAVMLATPGYLLLQVACLFVAWREGWWTAFLAPLLLAVPAALWCAHAYVQDANLWPLTFILFAPLGCVYLLVVLVLRAVLPTSGKPPAGPDGATTRGLGKVLSAIASII